MKRDIVIDIAKGIAIICVVLGHIKDSADLSLFPAHTKFVHQFHVPLFFFVSGMLYKAEEKWLPFIKKKIQRLYVPYVVSNIVFLVAFIVESLLAGSEIIAIDMVKHAVKICLFMARSPLGNPTWFLFILLVTSVLYKLLDEICSCLIGKSTILGRVLEWLLVFSMTVIGLKYRLPLGADRALVAIVFYHMGREVYHTLYQSFTEIKDWNKALMAIVSFICLLVFSRRNWVDMFCSNYGVVPIFFLSSLTGIIFVFSLSCLIAKVRYISDFFSYSGNKSMWILIGHTPVFYAISLIQKLIYPGLLASYTWHSPWITRGGWFAVYLVLGIGVPMLLARIKDYR